MESIFFGGLGETESIGDGAGLDDVRTASEPVADSDGEERVLGDLAPLEERRVAGDGDRWAVLAVGQDLRRQSSVLRVEVELVELVQAEQVETAVAVDEARGLTIVGVLCGFSLNRNAFDQTEAVGPSTSG